MQAAIATSLGTISGVGLYHGLGVPDQRRFCSRISIGHGIGHIRLDRKIAGSMECSLARLERHRSETLLRCTYNTAERYR